MADILVPQAGMTFYGDKIISIRDMVRDADSEQAIRFGLVSIFSETGISVDLLADTMGCCIENARDCFDLSDYERSVRAFLEQSGVLQQYNIARKNRAAIRFEKVRAFLSSKTVLDLGCGGGKIGVMVRDEGYDVTLADVYRNPNIDALQLPFSKITDGQTLPFGDATFDNILLMSMLHHTQDPMHTINECNRVLNMGGRLHLIETVYGIPLETKNGSYGTDDSHFRSLSTEQQRRVTMFFDYLANHILDAYTEDPEKYVPVPFNFTTPNNLERTFRDKGFQLLSKENLGIYPFSYVYHIHYVLEKNKHKRPKPPIFLN